MEAGNDRDCQHIASVSQWRLLSYFALPESRANDKQGILLRGRELDVTPWGRHGRDHSWGVEWAW
jgi:hypothetical protein